MKGFLLSSGKNKTGYRNLRYIFKRYGTDTILVLSLLVGTIAGAVCAGNADAQLIAKLDFIFISDFHARCNQTVMYSFVASLTANFLFFISNVLFGLSVWGILGVMFLIGFKGFGISLTGGYMYKYYGFAGVGFFLLVMLAGYAISAVALIQQGKNSIIFSRNLLAKVQGSQVQNHPTFYGYIVNNSFTLIALAIGSMADAVLNTLFAGIFNFS